jgi:hypothetical protein
MRLCSSIVSLATILPLYNSGHAQEKPVEPAPAQSETKPTANTRLKIGAALEGGGALGIAHLVGPVLIGGSVGDTGPSEGTFGPMLVWVWSS